MILTILTPEEEQLFDNLPDPLFISEVHEDMQRYKVGIKLDDGTLVGMMILFNISETHQKAEFGIRIIESRGVPVAAKAFVGFISDIFNKTPLNRIYMRIHSDNKRCLSNAERIGLRYEGTEREALCIDGKFKDVIVMSVLRSDYERGEQHGRK